MWQPSSEELKFLQLIASMCWDSASGKGPADKETFFLTLHMILQRMGDQRVAYLLDACTGAADYLSEMKAGDPDDREAVEFMIIALRKAAKSDVEFYCPERLEEGKDG